MPGGNVKTLAMTVEVHWIEVRTGVRFPSAPLFYVFSGGGFMPTEKELTDSLLQMYAENRRARYAQDMAEELDYQAAMLKERLAHLGVTDLSQFEKQRKN